MRRPARGEDTTITRRGTPQASHRGRLGLPVGRRALLRSRLVGAPRTRGASAGGRRQRGGRRAGEGLAASAVGTRGAVPLFVFDAGYDPVKLQRGLEGHRAHVLVRLHSNRAFYADPEEAEPRPVGRPRRHGNKFALPDPRPGQRPPASIAPHRSYGDVRVRAWSGLHPKTRRIGERYGCERAPVVRGTVILVEVAKLPARPASRRSCGFGGTEKANPTSTSCGEPTSGGSTWSTRSASSSRRSGGPHRGLGTPSRRIAGRGWCS